MNCGQKSLVPLHLHAHFLDNRPATSACRPPTLHTHTCTRHIPPVATNPCNACSARARVQRLGQGGPTGACARAPRRATRQRACARSLFRSRSIDAARPANMCGLPLAHLLPSSGNHMLLYTVLTPQDLQTCRKRMRRRRAMTSIAVVLCPPKAARKGRRQRLDKVPPLGRNVKQVPRLEHRLEERRGREQRKGGREVRALEVGAARVGVQSGRMRVHGGRRLGRVEAHILAADDLLTAHGMA